MTDVKFPDPDWEHPKERDYRFRCELEAYECALTAHDMLRAKEEQLMEQVDALSKRVAWQESEPTLDGAMRMARDEDLAALENARSDLAEVRRQLEDARSIIDS